MTGARHRAGGSGRTGGDHAHDGSRHAHAHTHAVSADADRRLISAALVLLLTFLVAEVAVGLLARSLALLADAGHLLTDVAALGMALVASRLAARPARGSYTYGLRRVEILSAQANGITLVLLAALFVVEGVRRLVHPPTVEAGAVLAVALVGVVVNLGAAWLLGRADRGSLNVEGAFQHIVTDLYAFLGTAVAAVVVLTTGWHRADPLATLVIAALMLHAGSRLVRESGRVFLEAAPRGIDPAAVQAGILAGSGVLEVHELHVWEVTSGFPALSAHVLVDTTCDCHATRVQLEQVLAEHFGIDHTTLQVDHRDALLPRPGSRPPADAPVDVRPHGGHATALGATGDHAHGAATAGRHDVPGPGGALRRGECR